MTSYLFAFLCFCGCSLFNFDHIGFCQSLVAYGSHDLASAETRDNVNVQSESNSTSILPSIGIDFSDWIVTSNSLGPIKIGSALGSNLIYLKNFQKKKAPVYHIGLDGENLVDYYFLDGGMAFYLHVVNAKIIRIYVLHPGFKTADGIGIGSTAAEIIKACPDMVFEFMMMTGADFAKSAKCGLNFDFEESICDYPDGQGVNGKPVRTSIKPVRMYID